MQVREEGMSLLSDKVSLMCLEISGGERARA